MTNSQTETTAKVVVATTVALSFISFWRGAAIVLSDLASSMFYVGGIAEQAIGKRPLVHPRRHAVQLRRALRLHGELQHVRARRRVRRGARRMGPFMARLSVSALVFDYILTGPISVVSAGQYLGRLLNEISELGASAAARESRTTFAVFFGVAVTAYFWWSNIKGIHESSGKALRIMQITTVMVVDSADLVPADAADSRQRRSCRPRPLPANLQFTPESLGWLRGHVLAATGLRGLMIIAFGHSLLAMSGFETLAQVYREIAYPKLKNLKITANIVCIYALVSAPA